MGQIALTETREDRLFDRAMAILDGRGIGLGEVILWHLTLRRYCPAMLALAGRATVDGGREALGRSQDGFSPAGLMYRAYKVGQSSTAAQNLARTLFYAGDMAGYRQWLRRAARLGDDNAAQELRRFELRHPWPLARCIRKARPFRRDER